MGKKYNGVEDISTWSGDPRETSLVSIGQTTQIPDGERTTGALRHIMGLDAGPVPKGKIPKDYQEGIPRT